MIRKYLLPFLAIVGLGAAIFMVIQGNRTVSVVQPVVQSAQAEVEQIKSQIASAKAQVEQIESDIGLRIIRAPISGRILQMKTRLGEYAQSGVLSTPLMLLGDDTTLHVRG